MSICRALCKVHSPSTPRDSLSLRDWRESLWWLRSCTLRWRAKTQRPAGAPRRQRRDVRDGPRWRSYHQCLRPLAGAPHPDLSLTPSLTLLRHTPHHDRSGCTHSHKRPARSSLERPASAKHRLVNCTLQAPPHTLEQPIQPQQHLQGTSRRHPSISRPD